MSERLRVLFLANALGIGGAERQLVELARGLDRRRFEPVVTVLYPGGPLERELAEAGVRLVSLDRRGRFDFTTVASLARLLRREGVHVIQPYLTPATFFGLSAALAARTPVRVATERSGGVRLDRGGPGAWLYEWSQYRLMRAAADVVVANSEAGREDVVAHGVPRGKTMVIYNGVNPERVSATEAETAAARRELGLPPEARVAGIVARLAPEKDHETFLRAAALVRRACPEAHFLVVGEGPERERLERLAAELGVAPFVRFTGSLVRVAPVIANLDVAVLCSVDVEGCSNFLLEAMGLGKPAVCTDVGGNREVVRDGRTGFLVPCRDPEALAGRMLTLLRDPARARALGEAGREEFHARFSLARMVEAYERLYLELWERRRAGAGAPSAPVPAERR